MILETAEYATNGAYFSYETLDNKELNPKLDTEAFGDKLISLQDVDYTETEEGSLVTVSLNLDEAAERGYLIIGDRQFDFSIDQEGNTAECTLDVRYFQEDLAQIFFQ